MNVKSIKRISFAAFILLAVALFYFSADFSGFCPPAQENFEKYSRDLANISENYFDDYDSRIIVKSDRELSDRGSVMRASGFAGLNVFQYASASDADRALRYYSSLSYVEYAVKDGVVYGEDDVISDNEGFALPTHTPAEIDQMKAGYLSWGAEMLGIERYQRLINEKYEAEGKDLPTVYVAVLDTGIDTDNEYLQGRIATEYGRNFYEAFNPTKFEDDYYHGTHVSGTIADLTLPNVKIIPVKVLNDQNSGSVVGIVNGMQYVLELKKQGVNIVAYNMSLGGQGRHQGEHDAIISSYQNNLLAVVSAGNSSYYVENVTPGNCETALTIAALAENEVYEKFPHIADYSNYGQFIDLALPGTQVLSSVPDHYSGGYTSTTGGRYAYLNGTSMAAPHATAMVALYATYYGDEYSVENAEKTLKGSAIDLGDLGFDTQYGYGVPTFDNIFSENTLNAEPTLSIGSVGGKVNFQENEISVAITDNNVADGELKIYYSLDGSAPTLRYHEEYLDGITINESSLLRIVIYRFDGERVINRSEIYEATYYKGAQTVNDDGTGFEINANGRLTSYTSGLKDIIIPEYVNGTKVTGFGKYLFRGLNVETVVADKALHMNGFHPFYCVSTLKSLTIASANWNPAPGGPDLEMSVLAKACYGLKELNFPNLAYIPSSDQGELSDIKNGVKGSKLFEACTSLERLYAPKVTDVRNGAFSCFARLSEIELDFENLNKIGDYAFDRCAALNMAVTFAAQSGKSYTLGKHAFEGSAITSFQSDVLTSIPENAFADCKSLASVDTAEAETLGANAFSGCESLTEAAMPKLKTIGAHAFEKCVALEGIELANVESVGEYAFSGAGLESADLSSLKTMGDSAFLDCQKLLYVKLGTNADIINYANTWVASYYTKILLIDREYNGKIGNFIKGSYPSKYDFAEYNYLIYSAKEIFTATYRLNANKVVSTRRFMYGDRLTAPESYMLGAHAEITFESWKEKGGQTYNKSNLPNANKNYDFTASEYSAEYLTPHEDDGWQTVNEAGCTVDGLKEKRCALCGELIASEKIDAHGHEPHEVVDSEATCTESGMTRSVCNICGETLESTVTPATGHTPEAVVEKEATCTENGVLRTSCSRCGKTMSVAPIIASHDEEAIEGREPTCTETGLTAGKRCKKCNEITVSQEVIPITHDEETIEGREPTCTETGLTAGKRCKKCNTITVKQESIPALGHSWGEWVPVTSETGTEKAETRQCNNCSETERRTVIDMEKTADFVEKAGKVALNSSLEGKYEAIKSALNAYALLSNEEKESVADDYEKLLSAIESYNESAQRINGSLTAGLKTGMAVGATAVATVALALAAALLKRRIL